MMPMLGFTYTSDAQQAYKDTLGNIIPEQTIALSQLTLGMDFNMPIDVELGELNLVGGVSGIHSSTKGGDADYEGMRGRTELGFQRTFANGGNLGAKAFYDGIGSDYEGYGVSLDFKLQF